ncbi:hypothetical protein [Pedobacter flavus]|uniref:O-antigen ligase domain-containing protein n=1 Tax=Pedobacter flavus TaxID=3113906 RepID=A0ABU7H2C1_9SPHI|nr:hypothetical protein [Pedobacter sp. VNH31]MEE1884716.1 hypothetical protein [Pedobacter sp. VNH31]
MDRTINYNLHFSPGKWMHIGMFFTIFFPFIPSIIPGTDTQPTFFLLFNCSMIYLLVNYQYQSRYFELNYNKIGAISALFGLILMSVILAKLFIASPTLWARIISFLQFSFALFFAYNSAYFFKIESLKKVFWVFAIFSVIYFLTHGLVERILISSRTDSFEMLAASGRGAKTLSPEPSFFALHMFNLYLIFHLLASKESKKKYGDVVFWLTSFCLLASLSGYGFIIFLLILSMRYTKTMIIFGLIFMASSGLILNYFDSLADFRGIKLLTEILLKNPALILNDASFASRFGSFFAYIENIKNNFIFGDGFTLLQGGGFISIVSSLGLLAAIFLIYVIVQIFKLKDGSAALKFMLVFWFLLNLFSGPIGIPTLGVIVGLILRRNLKQNNFLKFQNLSNA